MRRTPRQDRRHLAWAIVAGGIVLRLVLVLVVYNSHPERATVNDSPTYTEPALALLDDGDFDRSPDTATPEFIRTPGYPLYIAVVYGLTGDSDMALLVTQAVISGLAIALAMAIASHLTDSPTIPLAVGALVALDPIQAAFTGIIITETLASVLVPLVAYCGIRWVQSNLSRSWGFAFAGAIAAATYVRPTTYYVALLAAVIVAAPALWDRQRRPMLLRAAATVLIPCVALLGVWNVRNHSELDSWRFSGIEGLNLYWYRAADVVAARDGLSLEDARLQLTRQLNEGEVPAFDYAEHSHGTLPPAWEDRQGAYYDRAYSEGLAILRSEPILTARQFVRGIYSQIVQSGWGDAYSYATGRTAPTPVIALSVAIILGIEALALVGMATSVRQPGPNRLAHILTIALLAYIILASAGAEAASGYRFRVPIWAIWTLYAVIGAQQLARWARFRLRADQPSRHVYRAPEPPSLVHHASSSHERRADYNSGP